MYENVPDMVVTNKMILPSLQSGGAQPSVHPDLHTPSVVSHVPDLHRPQSYRQFIPYVPLAQTVKKTLV